MHNFEYLRRVSVSNFKSRAQGFLMKSQSRRFNQVSVSLSKVTVPTASLLHVKRVRPGCVRTPSVWA